MEQDNPASPAEDSAKSEESLATPEPPPKAKAGTMPVIHPNPVIRFRPIRLADELDEWGYRKR